MTLNAIVNVVVLENSRSFKGEGRGPLFIDEFETYRCGQDRRDSPCLLNTVVGMLLYVDDVVLLSRSSASLQRLLNKLC